MKKHISIVTPCFNEEKNIHDVYTQVKLIFNELPQYTYEHVFIDNASTDNTGSILRSLAAQDKQVKIIYNARNFGPVRSPYYGLLQATGDAVICLSADLQEPPQLMKQFLQKWEEGAKIVAGVKSNSQESKFIFFLRKLYYRIASKISEVKLIKNFHGFGLYDATIIKLFNDIDDPYPYLRGLVSELGYKITEIPYTQEARRHGKSKANFFVLYDWIMLGVTSHSKMPIRLMTIAGFFLSIVSLLISLSFIVLKVLFWSSFNLGIAPLLVGLFFFSSIQLLFIGLIGEYIISINTRVMKRPLVIEQERINFDA